MPEHGSDMMESMYGKDTFSKPNSNLAKIPETVDEIPNESKNRDGGFSSISNVRTKNPNLPPRPNLMNKLDSDSAS